MGGCLEQSFILFFTFREEASFATLGIFPGISDFSQKHLHCYVVFLEQTVDLENGLEGLAVGNHGVAFCFKKLETQTCLWMSLVLFLFN